MIKVSVVIPIYNAKRYVEKQINSILNQTMSDWEIILVDDDSTDNVKEVLDVYVEKDKRISAVYHQNNQGVAGGRRTGWMYAKGEYICFFDADDWTEPDALEKLWQLAKERNADVVSFSYFEEYEKQSKRFHFKEKKDISYTGKEAIAQLHQRRNILPHAWNKLYRKELLQDDMFIRDNLLGEDYGMLLKLFEAADIVVQTDRPYYHYSLRNGSTLDKGFSDFYKKGYFYYQGCEQQLILQYPEYEKDIRRYHLVEQMAIVVSMFKNNLYDHEIRKQVTRNVRDNLGLLLSGKGIACKFKMAAVVLCIHYKILKSGYLLLYKIERRKRRK